MKKYLAILCLLILPVRAIAFTSIPWVTEGFGYVPSNVNGKIELTDNNLNRDGVAWNPCPIDMTANWDLQFVFNFGSTQQTCGGDGMSFILQAASNNGNSPTTIAGPTSGNSDSGEKAFTGIPNSLEIAFNTYPHPYMPNQNASLNVLTNGNTEASYSDVVGCGTGLNQVVTGPCFPSISATEPLVQDGADHTVDINWNAGSRSLAVTFDGSGRGTWVLPASYALSLFGGSTSVVYGVGASSGGVTDFQSFAQTNANPNACQAAPTLGPTATPIPSPLNACGNTPAPTFTPAGPTNTPTITPTPWPTPCSPLPAFVQSSVLASGCAGSGNPTSFTYTVPAGPGQVLLAQVESTGPVISGVTWNNIALTQAPGSPVTGGGATIYTYYMVNPQAGTFTLAYAASTGCSWNAIASVYKNIDTANPFGTTRFNTGTSTDFSDTLATAAPYSIVHDLFAYTGGPNTFSMNSGQNQLFAPTAGGCCDNVYGSYLSTTGPGFTYSLDYIQANSKPWYAETIELRGMSACSTDTFTDTPTSTNSPSGTVTPSRTVTSTATPSRTVTVTNTPSFTQTFSFTQTPTSSATPSRTQTPTDTITSLNTATDTATVTPTLTQTPTRTSTVSFSSTSTQTSTRTVTASNSPSPSDTPTATITSTNSPGPSATDTATLSSTPTVTPTSTQTPSATGTPSSTLTSTASPSATSTPSSTVTPTETVTSPDTPTDTTTITVTSTQTLVNTPTDTRTGTSTPTDTSTVTLTATRSSTSTVSPSPTQTPSVTMTRTIVPTPMAFPNKVTISIYNSAGELVKNVFNGSAQYQPGGLSLDKTVVLGGSNSVFISFPGALADPSTGQSLSGVSWGAINNSGQGVSSGVYTIKAEIVDEFGQVTSLEQSISVMDVVPANTLTIYNSAGEVVANLPLPSGGTGRFSSLRLEADKLAVDIDPKTGGNLGVPLVIWLRDDQGTEQEVQWDGRNAQGLPVTSGTYIAELVYGTAGTRQTVSSKSFTVLQASPIASLAGAFAYPNPVQHGADFFISYSPSPGSTGAAHLYDLSGTLVAQADDSAQTGVLKFKGSALAGGVYIVKVEKLTGGGASLAHTLLKIAVTH